MKANLSTIDRVLRAVLALILAVLYFSGTVTGTLGIILLVLGGVLLLTSLLSFCPLYALVKFSTLKA